MMEDERGSADRSERRQLLRQLLGLVLAVLMGFEQPRRLPDLREARLLELRCSLPRLFQLSNQT
jgi:hypothetical protein